MLSSSGHGAGDAFEVPDVTDRGGELDVPHPLAAHFGAGHLDAAAIAGDAAELDLPVLAAMALPVADRAKIRSQKSPSGSGLNVR